MVEEKSWKFLLNSRESLRVVLSFIWKGDGRLQGRKSDAFILDTETNDREEIGQRAHEVSNCG